MDLTYLAIENNLAIHERESQFWKSRGIDSIRVSSMTEGIELASKHQFLYIGINADNIHYTSGLAVLRSSTNEPIFMACTNYTLQEQTLAARLGADLFGSLGDKPEYNFDAVMTRIQHLQSRSALNNTLAKPIVYRNIRLSDAHRLTLLNDREVDLTRNEFDLLYTLASRRGWVFTFEKLYDLVWGGDYDRASIETIKNTVARLRNKIADTSDKYFIIESVRNVGFKCPLL
jgi:DNA-binding response OmpR family regulator